MANVPAAEVRAGEAQHVGDLTEGKELGLEQCDDCGNVYYTAIMHGGRWFIRCTPNPEGIYAGIEGVGCGREVPVVLRDEEEVAF